MAAAAVSPPHDQNTDWVHELQRIVVASDSLPDAARRAVLATVDAFHAEDGSLPQPASSARTALAATLAAPEQDASLPTLGEALHAALKLRVRREPSPAQAHAA
jgi:hypothetical protein